MPEAHLKSCFNCLSPFLDLIISSSGRLQNNIEKWEASKVTGDLAKHCSESKHDPWNAVVNMVSILAVTNV